MRDAPDSKTTRRQRALLRARLANFGKLEREIERLESTMAAIVDYAEMIDEQCVPPVPEIVPDRDNEEAMLYDERNESTVQLLYDVGNASR